MIHHHSLYKIPRLLNYLARVSVTGQVQSSRRLLAAFCRTQKNQHPGNCRQQSSQPTAQLLRSALFETSLTSIEELEWQDVKTASELLAVFDHHFERLKQSGEPWHVIESYLIIALQRCQFNSNKTDMIHLCNTLIQRLQHDKLSIPPQLMFHAFKAAAAANSAFAVENYFRIIESEFPKDHYEQKADLQPWGDIAERILLVNKGVRFRGWKGIRQQHGWIKAITGQATDRVRQSHRHAAFYHVFLPFGIQGLKYYFRLLSRFCSSDVLFQDWQLTRKAYEADPSFFSQSIGFIIFSYVQLLIARGHPKQAWQVADESSRLGVVDDKTWRLLLQYPEHLATWHQEMNKFVIPTLERNLKYIERQLGVMWTGGEDGCHVAKINDRESP